MEWVIYYEDRPDFTSEDGAPHEAPSSGVLAIAYRDGEVGRVIRHLYDYYVWREDSGGWWAGADRSGLEDYLFDIPGAYKVVRRGRFTTNAKMQETILRARIDPRLPTKSGSYENERPQT